MRLELTVLGLTVAVFAGCSPIRPVPATTSSGSMTLNQPTDWSKYFGQTVTVEGRAVNAKLGARLFGEKASIWIDSLDSWPEGFYQGGDEGKRLRVTGTVIKRDDMPVYVEKSGVATRGGIAVESEAALERAKWRFLLKDARWTVLE